MASESRARATRSRLVVEDGKSTLDGNTAAATKLVLDEKVQFVIGPGAFFNVATSPILEQAKVLHVACYNGLQPGEMGPNTPYEFLGMDPINQQSAALKALKQYYPNVKTDLHGHGGRVRIRPSSRPSRISWTEAD